jgi:S1-C subfamily serine protease
LLEVAVVLLVLFAIALGSFVAAFRIGAVDSAALDRYRPGPLVTPAPSAAPRPRAQVAREALSRVVTIEVQTDQGEEFGSGWLFDVHGDFVTNYHVIARRHSVRIVDRRSRSHDGVVLGYSAPDDIAVIHATDGFDAQPLSIGPRGDAPVPEPVVVLASSAATTHGDTTLETLVRLHQPVPVATDPEGQTGDSGQATYGDMMVLRDNRIYRGNSGGPVLDQFGRVIGIVTLASQSSAQAFAIPVGRVIDDIVGFAGRQAQAG